MQRLVFLLLLCCASARADAPPVQLGGYVEAFYQWSFDRPANGITNFRGFDNRHNTFTLSNVALDAQWDRANVLGRVTLQVGHTPSTYYLAEPALPGASGANASSSELWKYVQQAYAGYRVMLERELFVSAGVFLSPIGPESMAVRDNWNWSRSNLFFGLPFYHTGVRASYSLTPAWSVVLAAYNGWNTVVDNNADKSLSAQLLFTRPELTVSVLYFGGVERAESFRHLFDAHATWSASPRLSFIAHANAGFEAHAHWQAGAVYARVLILPTLFAAVRGDVFFEHAADSSNRIFWPADWVSSGTLTCDYRPSDKASFRLEYRHDQAASEMYVGPRASQDTLTLGATTWF